MWRSLAALELDLQRRSPVTWLLAAVTAALGAALATGSLSAIPQLVSPAGAPYALAYNLAALSWGLLALAVVPVTRCALRDDEYRTAGLLRVTTGRRQYAFGRAAAALVLTLALMLCGVAGYVAAALGAVDVSVLVGTLWWIALPNALSIAALIFSTAALGRTLTMGWIGAFMLVGLVVLGLGNGPIGPRFYLSEAFAFRVVFTDILALPPSTLATAPLHLGNALLANRAFWLVVALALFTLAVALGYRRVDAHSPKTAASKGAGRVGFARLPERPALLAQGLRLAAFDLAFLFRSLTVWVGLPVLVFVLVEGVGTLAPPFYLPNLPTQAELLSHLAGPYQWAAMAWVVLLAIDLCQREHDQRIVALTRLLPISAGTRLFAKAAALCMLVLLLQGAATLSLLTVTGGMPSNTFFLGTLMSAVPIALAACAAVTMQAWTGTRHGAYLGLLLVAGLGFALSALSISPGLVQFARLPSLHLSDLLGIADARDRWVAYATYWMLATVALGLAALSRQVKWAGRAAVLSGLLWLGFGCWLYLQSAPFTIRGDGWQVAYERALRAYADAPRPDLIHVELTAHFEPARRAVRLEGVQTFRRSSEDAVGALAFSLPMGTATELQVLAPHKVIADGLGYRVISLATPLSPGGEVKVRYVTTLQAPWMASDPQLSMQGQTIFSPLFQPGLQYQSEREIQDPRRRAELGLAGAAFSSDAETVQPYRLLGTGNGRRIEFHASLKVPVGWTAVAPGRLLAVTPQKDGSREFVYAATQPISPMFALAAQPWREKKAQVGNDSLRLLHGPTHAANLAHIQTTAKAALDRFGALFGAYPNSVLTIAEVPNGSTNPLSQPGLILLPENAGYVQDLNMGGLFGFAQKQLAVDPTVLVVAHEIAHQWWGLQFSAAEAPGGTWLTESIPQYFALVLLEELQGIQRLRAASMQQRVAYFDGHRPGLHECALTACTYLSPYLAYAKGGLVWLTLEDAVGRKALQAALAEHYRQQQGFALAQDLLSRLKRSFPAQERLIEELFEQVATHQLAIRAATPTADGRRLQVTLAFATQPQDATPPVGRRRIWLEFQTRRGEQVGRHVLELHSGVHAVELPLPTGASRLVVDPDFKLLEAERNDNIATW
ncbi:MAG: M1 family aminopeptidase [Xanthomonadaceae bacterium]|nr:M1 family aminopeptidase [Xanthomonadaceae bacterium]